MAPESFRILLVEDNPGDARLVQEALRAPGPGRYHVEHVLQLSEAQRRLNEEDFDAVLLDLSLPDSKGLDTVARARRGAGGVPIVVLTGLNDDEAAVGALQAGAQDYLVKGRIDGDSARRALRYAIERAKREQADVLRKSQTTHIWRSVFRTLGPGASAVLYGAGESAGSDCYDFLQETWGPRDDREFVRAMEEHLRVAGVCELRELTIDRAASGAIARVQGNFEASQHDGSPREPVCHFLRGLLCGTLSRVMERQELVCDERTCQARGDEACEFIVRPMFG